MCLFASGGFLITHPKVDAGVARMQRASRFDVAQVEEICGRLGVHRVVIEPALRGVWVDAKGARHSWGIDAPISGAQIEGACRWAVVQSPIAHTRTNVVDLSSDLETVVSRFATVARRNVRAAQAAPIRYEVVAFDQAKPPVEEALRGLYDGFLEAHQNLSDEWAVRRSITTHFADRGHHVLAWSESRLVGAIDLLLHDRVAYYFAAMSDAEGMKARVPTGLVHAAMAFAKQQGCDLFDFVGVHDERFPTRRRTWIGFSKFKARFGGVDVCLDPGVTATLEPG